MKSSAPNVRIYPHETKGYIAKVYITSVIRQTGKRRDSAWLTFPYYAKDRPVSPGSLVDSPRSFPPFVAPPSSRVAGSRSVEAPSSRPGQGVGRAGSGAGKFRTTGQESATAKRRVGDRPFNVFSVFPSLYDVNGDPAHMRPVWRFARVYRGSVFPCVFVCSFPFGAGFPFIFRRPWGSARPFIFCRRGRFAERHLPSRRKVPSVPSRFLAVLTVFLRRRRSCLPVFPEVHRSSPKPLEIFGPFLQIVLLKTG